MNHSLPGFFAKIFGYRNQHGLVAIVFTLTTLTCFAISSLTLNAATQTGKRHRVIEETPYPDAPVKVVGVLNRKYKIKFKESFLDDDDWIKGLEFEVINNSEKTVTHVGIDLLFERPSSQTSEPRALWPLGYGLNPFRLNAGDPIVSGKFKPIRPGHKVSITLSDLEYEHLKALLRETRYFDGVEKMKIFVTTIGFDDGTAWGGSFYIRDPSAPNGWRPQEKIGAARKKVLPFFPFLSPSTKLENCMRKITCP